MKKFLKDKEHLVRVALLFAGGLVLFVLVRAVLVPKGFGLYGHYRAGALADNMARPLSFAGRDACEGCHTDVVEFRKGSKHAAIGCESCHGPLAKHAEDPSALKPERPEPKALCLGCHAANVAKPRGFKQIDPKEHFAGEACAGCHAPHAPQKEPKK